MVIKIVPGEWDAERKRQEEQIPAHLDWLPETAQLRIPVLNAYKARAVPEILRELAANIEAVQRSHTLSRGSMAFEIHGYVRGAQAQISGKFKKRKG